MYSSSTLHNVIKSRKRKIDRYNGQGQSGLGNESSDIGWRVDSYVAFGQEDVGRKAK